jgi:hypothetical protein
MTEATPTRQLLTIEANVKNSRDCLKSCIDKKQNFCPIDAEFTVGNCCSEDKCEGAFDFCSRDASAMYEM